MQIRTKRKTASTLTGVLTFTRLEAFEDDSIKVRYQRELQEPWSIEKFESCVLKYYSTEGRALAQRLSREAFAAAFHLKLDSKEADAVSVVRESDAPGVALRVVTDPKSRLAIEAMFLMVIFGGFTEDFHGKVTGKSQEILECYLKRLPALPVRQEAIILDILYTLAPWQPMPANRYLDQGYFAQKWTDMTMISSRSSVPARNPWVGIPPASIAVVPHGIFPYCMNELRRKVNEVVQEPLCYQRLGLKTSAMAMTMAMDGDHDAHRAEIDEIVLELKYTHFQSSSLFMFYDKTLCTDPAIENLRDMPKTSYETNVSIGEYAARNTKMEESDLEGLVWYPMALNTTRDGCEFLTRWFDWALKKGFLKLVPKDTPPRVKINLRRGDYQLIPYAQYLTEWHGVDALVQEIDMCAALEERDARAAELHEQ